MSDTYAKIEKFSIDLSPKSNSAEMVDIQVCVHGCRSLFPYDSFIHFGVRWDAVSSKIECWCLMSDTFDTSMIGPQVKIRYKITKAWEYCLHLSTHSLLKVNYHFTDSM